MGKRIISQARGKGSHTYRVRKKAFRFKVQYPMHEGKAEVLKLFNSAAHTAPLLKMKIGNEVFYNVAFNGALEGQEIEIGGKENVDVYFEYMNKLNAKGVLMFLKSDFSKIIIKKLLKTADLLTVIEDSDAEPCLFEEYCQLSETHWRTSPHYCR